MQIKDILKKYTIIVLCIIISTNYVYAEFEEENGRDHIVGTTEIEIESPYVFSNFEKNGVFYIYNNNTIPMYNSPSTSSSIVGQLEPQLLIANKRKGNYFYVNTSKGYKWIYKNSDVQMREIEDFSNSRFIIAEDLILHTQPFTIYRTERVVPKGIYNIKRKSGDWFYIEENGLSGWFYTENGKFENSIEKLNTSNIKDIPLKQKIAKYSNNVRPGNPMKPKYIIIHNTANTSKGANAQAHANLLYNKSVNGGTVSSWHFTVDDKEIYQSLPIDEIGYHAGDGDGPGNRSGVGIEICENSDGDYSKAEDNAVKLTAQLLYELNLPISSVKAHKDFSGKNCPARILGRSNGWESFIKKVEQEYNKLNISKDKYYLDMFSFYGEESVKSSKEALERETGWYLEYEKVKLNTDTNEYYDTTPIYRIVTGEFNGLESVQNAIKELERKYGWWATYESTSNHNKYRIVTGGFNGIHAVQNAIKELEKTYGWWATYEDTGDFKYNYRLVTGYFPNEKVVSDAANFIRNSYGWHTEIKIWK